MEGEDGFSGWHIYVVGISKGGEGGVLCASSVEEWLFGVVGGMRVGLEDGVEVRGTGVFFLQKCRICCRISICRSSRETSPFWKVSCGTAVWYYENDQLYARPMFSS